MPCRSYDDDIHYGPNGSSEIQKLIEDQRKLVDRLARISCRALTLLEEIQLTCNKEVGKNIDEVLADPEIAEWWPAHKLADAKAKLAERSAELRKQEAQDKKRKKAILLSKLSKEDKEILGIKE